MAAFGARREAQSAHIFMVTSTLQLSPGLGRGARFDESRRANFLAGIARATAYSCFLLVSAPLLYHLFTGSTAYLGFFEDDYFYYSAVADNLVREGRFTYDGSTVTNGFHPLWLGLLGLLRLIAGRFGSAYYLGFTAIAFMAMIATFELGVLFARMLGLRRGIAETASALYAVGTGCLMTSGMEAAIAVPLLLWLFIESGAPGALTMKRAARLGLIASLAILARLDVVIVVALLIAGYAAICRPPLVRAARLFAAFCAGGFLLPLYLSVNILAFHSVMPVSAMAKQLWSGLGLNLNYVRSVAFNTVYGPSVGVLLPAGAFACIILARRSRWTLSWTDFIGASALAFAFALWGINALSGWIFFGWYAFPIAPASLAAAAFVWRQWGWIAGTRRWLGPALAIAALGLPFGTAVRYFVQHGPMWSISDNALLAASYDLAPRMQKRQGVLAMGAIAGFVGYVMDRPLVQLEGLMADRRMVEHVRNEDALEDVLREYNVDYLIVSFAGIRVNEADGCYEITQPHVEWAGPRTKKMRGVICSPPVERVVTPAGSNPWSQFPSIETLVWDVRNSHWKRRDSS
jgi:hypothetical protein